MNLQCSNHTNNAGYTDYDGPLDAAKRMPLEGRLAYFPGELGIGVIKLLLYLMKDALFVVRERHLVFRSSIPPV